VKTIEAIMTEATPPSSWKLPEGIEGHIEDGTSIGYKNIATLDERI